MNPISENNAKPQGCVFQDVLIAETNWPEACPSSVALSEPSIPVSASGQQTWVHDIENVLAALPSGHGLGIVYWEPGWIGNAGLGSSCSVSAGLFNNCPGTHRNPW